MKTLLSFFSFLLAFTATAQVQIADSIALKEVNLSLKGKHHSLIYALMPNKGTTEAINYVNQISKAVHLANKRDSLGTLILDTAQVISAVTTYRMVFDNYFNLSEKKEGLTAQDNAEMKDALLKQLYNLQTMDLLLALKDIDDYQRANRERIRKEGANLILAVKDY